MSRILFSLASPIIRPNGIVTFITSSARILRQMGHKVDLITDAKPSVNLSGWFDTVFYDKTPAQYPEIVVNGKPRIDFLPQIQMRIYKAYRDNDLAGHYDLIIGNDAQSTAAFIDEPTRLIHYAHTAALLGRNDTFLTDHMVEMERQLMSYVEVAGPHKTMLKNIGHPDGTVIHLPIEGHEEYLLKPGETQSGLTFVGEGTLRKGADRFEEVVVKMGLDARIVSSSSLEVTFDRIPEERRTIRSFAPSEWKEKAAFIRQGKAGYHPALSETWGYAVPEMLLSKPVVLTDQFSWTEPHAELGALVVSPNQVEATIEMVMSEDYKHDNEPVLEYLNGVVPSWRRCLANK